jgi:hypothetical protein
VSIRRPADKSKISWTLLKGQALSCFENHLKKRLDAKDVELLDNVFLELVICDVSSEVGQFLVLHVYSYLTP